MKEKEIEKRLITGVKNLGGKAYKWVSPGNAGVLVLYGWNQVKEFLEGCHKNGV